MPAGVDIEIEETFEVTSLQDEEVEDAEKSAQQAAK